MLLLKSSNVRSVKLYLLHSFIKILSSVRIGKVPYDPYVKERREV